MTRRTSCAARVDGTDALSESHAPDYVRTMLKREIVLPPEHLYPPDELRVVEARYTEGYADRAETVFAVGNGFLGVRGCIAGAGPLGPIRAPTASPPNTPAAPPGRKDRSR